MWPSQQIIDRRLSGKNKSIGNRERFLRRYKEQIRRRCAAVAGRSIRDMEQGRRRHPAARDVSEPVFGHARAAPRVRAPRQPGVPAGDRIAAAPRRRRRRLGRGEAQRQDGEGEDDFVFRLTREEFMRVLLRRPGAAAPHPHADRRRARVEEPPRRLHSDGNAHQPARGALDARRAGRRIALGGEPRKELQAAGGAPAASAAASAGRAGLHPDEIRETEAHRRAAPHACARALPRPHRPALPQPRARAGAHQPRP
jgi:hypothetical protein